MNKRIEKGLATRQHIVRVANDLFARLGYERSSIEAVLQESGISRGALYHHFPSKEALFEAVLEALEGEVVQRIATAARGIADPVEALRVGSAAFLRLAQEPAARQILLIDAPTALGWRKWREIDARYGFGLIKASLAAAASDGRLRPDLVESVAHLLLASLMELALVVARAEDPATATRQAETAVTGVIDALCGPRPSPR
jgi:AcrR family transcriptional regulator